MDIVRETEWREIPGWSGYRVSNKGVVQSCKGFGPQGIIPGRWRDLKPRPNKNKYLYVNPSQNGRAINIAVHHWVLIAFGLPRPDGMEVRHKNGNRQDNRLENLSWATHVENEHDKIEHGTRCYGEDHGCSRLTEIEVREIVRQIDDCGTSFRQLAKRFGVSEATIQHIAYGKTWKSITNPGLAERVEFLQTRLRGTLLPAFGEQKSVREWSRDSRCVVPFATLRERVRRGFSMEQALLRPLRGSQVSCP